MKIIVDTNLLVRIVSGDDDRQAQIALDVLDSAEIVALPAVVLCELAWVLRRLYRLKPDEIARAIRAMISRENVALNWPAAEAGLKMLDSGGDYADGVIAFEGRRLGGEVFVSFDREAVRLLEATSQLTKLLQ